MTVQRFFQHYYWHFIWSITVVFLLWVARSFFDTGYFLGHDVNAHITRAQSYLSAWREGQFPVRWIGWAFNDAGTPLFNYYPVGFYLVIGSLVQLHIPFELAFQGTIMLAWLGSGVGVALWMKRFGNLAAWLGALVWWFSPYIAMDIFIRSAFPELLALCWGLFGWWSWDRFVITHELTFGWLSSLFFAAIIATHLPTALILFPGYGLYFFIMSRRPTKDWKQLTGIGLMIMGLAAFYVVPALVELPLIQSNGLKEGFYDYRWHFLQPWQLFVGTWRYGYSNPGTTDDVSFAQAPYQWLVIIMTFLCLSYGRIKQKFAWFWLIVSGVALFLILQPAMVFWQLLPVLHFIQYPWRLLMLFSLGTAALTGWISSLRKQWWFQIGWAVIVIVGFVVPAIQRFQPFDRLPFSMYDLTRFASHEVSYPEVGVETAYLPVGVSVDNLQGLTLQETPTINRSAEVMYETNYRKPTFLIVKRWWFPGWKATINGQNIPINKNSHGLIEIIVPAGKNAVRVTYEGTALQQWMNRVTLISLLFWLARLCKLIQINRLFTNRL